MPVTVEGPLADDEWDGTTPLIIGRVQTDVNVWRFKAEVMAHIRSVEQQYWSLAQQHTQLEASEKAVALTQDLLKIEEEEVPNHGTMDVVAEIRERLEQFRLDLITKTCDVNTTERQLRNIMGLPASDRRRIVPISDLIEERREPDWNECLATMQSAAAGHRRAAGDRLHGGDAGPGGHRLRAGRRVLRHALIRCRRRGGDPAGV